MYGYRKIHHDLLSLGEYCAPNTVAKLMRNEGLRAQVGYTHPAPLAFCKAAQNSACREQNPHSRCGSDARGAGV